MFVMCEIKIPRECQLHFIIMKFSILFFKGDEISDGDDDDNSDDADQEEDEEKAKKQKLRKDEKVASSTIKAKCVFCGQGFLCANLKKHLNTCRKKECQEITL